MPINFKAWLFHSNSFCFCIPVRAGFVLMSVLTFLLSGTISVIIWFEVSRTSLSWTANSALTKMVRFLPVFHQGTGSFFFDWDRRESLVFGIYRRVRMPHGSSPTNALSQLRLTGLSVLSHASSCSPRSTHISSTFISSSISSSGYTSS
jgi:hypothetical protein